MRGKHLILSATILSLMLLPSCALIPQEEATRTVPLVRTYVREDFETVAVERGDLIKTARVSCRYVPVQTASLSFTLGGEYVDTLLVSVGDSVETGQLLGQLQLGDLEERIAKTETAIAELDLEMVYLGKKYELALRRHEITGAGLDPQAQAEALARLEADYAAQSKTVTDALELQYLTLASLEKDLEDRRIYAPFAGTVTYADSFDDGERSVFGKSVVTIADSTMSLFRAETDHWGLFHPGDEYDITANKTTYAAVVTDEAALGLPAQEKVEGKRAYVYFVLKETTFDLEDDAHGTIDIVLDERRDVLYVNKKAVSGADGQPIVYYKREDGMKAYKPVETGLVVDDRIEIVSGLMEGERVIVD